MGSNLPEIWTPKQVADYLKVAEDTIIRELEGGRLSGFKIGPEWRISDNSINDYINGNIPKILPHRETQPLFNTEQDWEIHEIEPFDFNWPKTGGGGLPEHYDKAFEATKMIDGLQYTFKIGFGNRKVAGQMRRRVTIWLGNRALVEFAGGNNYEKDGLLAGIIRLKNGKQLITQRIPDEYKEFNIGRYNSIVDGPRSSTGMAVIVNTKELGKMLEHAVIRARWKEVINTGVNEV